jgi:hypothetical protein
VEQMWSQRGGSRGGRCCGMVQREDVDANWGKDRTQRHRGVGRSHVEMTSGKGDVGFGLGDGGGSGQEAQSTEERIRVGGESNQRIRSLD